MSVRCLFIGDPHIRLGDVERTENMCNKVVAEAERLKPDFILISGDLFNDFENIKVTVLRRVVDFAKRLVKIAYLIFIVGNHERVNNSDFCTRIHSLAAFEEWPNVMVVDKMKQKTIKGLKFTFVPYTAPGRLEEALGPKDKWYNSAAIFGHHEIRGSKINDKICTDGDTWPEDYPFFFSGHIHEYQSIGDNIHYPGNPMQLNYGDSTDKSISLLTLTADSWEEERIYTEVPCKIKITLSVKEFEEMEKPDYDVVKITIKDTMENINTIRKCKKIKEYISEGFVINTLYTEDSISDIDGAGDPNQTELELVERKVEDYDKLLFERVQAEDKNVRGQFKYIFPDVVGKYRSK